MKTIVKMMCILLSMSFVAQTSAHSKAGIFLNKPKMKAKLLLLFCIVFVGTVSAQKRRVGINGSFQGDNAFTVEGFSYLSSTNLEQTSFIITNKTADEVEISFEMAITYTCNRVKKDKRTSITLKGHASYEVGTYMNSTSDKNCITTNTDGTKTTIVGITYLGLVTKNISALQRERKKKFDALVSNVSKYYHAKDYENAIEALTRVAEVASSSEEVRVKNEWDAKIRLAMQTKQQQNAQTEGNAGKGKMSSDLQKGVRREAEADFWEDKPATNSVANLERGGDNKEAYKVYEKRKEAEEKKARQEQAYINNLNRQLAENEKERQENARKIDAWGNNMYNTYYAAQAATDARNRLNENSKLSGNYNSVEELEAEFNQKYNSINQDVQEWNEASNQSIQSGANLLFNDGSSSGQAAGELVGMLGSWVNNNKAAKEARERKEKLEKERNAHLEELNRKKWNAILELRKRLFSQFVDGGTPLSRHRIQSPEVYCFVYSFPPGSMNETSPNLYISNVFPVTQYNDRTWPFKASLVTDIKKKTKAQDVVLMGYYTDKGMAEKMRSSLVSLSAKAQLKKLDISYTRSGAQAGAIASSDDFWETGKTDKASKASSETKSNTKATSTKKKEDDFWNN